MSELYIPKYFCDYAQTLSSNEESTGCRAVCTCKNELFDLYYLHFLWSKADSLKSKEMQKEFEEQYRQFDNEYISFQTEIERQHGKTNVSSGFYMDKQYYVLSKQRLTSQEIEKGKFLEPNGCVAFIDITANHKILQTILKKRKNSYDYITAKCKHCGKEILLFDSRYYGYDGVCTHFEQPNKQYGTDGKLKMKKPHCDDAGYKIYVTFSSTGKEDLIDNEGITEANWKDAFDWIRIDLECSKCGTRKNVIDLETM